jgi:hypothetical protein
MPRDPNIPDEFDVFTVVILRRPADAPRCRTRSLTRSRYATSPTVQS